jgi:hypothetical protein
MEVSGGQVMPKTLVAVLVLVAMNLFPPSPGDARATPAHKCVAGKLKVVGKGGDPTESWGSEVAMGPIARSFGNALVVIASVVVAEPASAATTTQRCEVAKLRAAGKEVRAKMACYAKAKAAVAPVDSTCLTRAQTKADATINAADGDCNGTASDIDSAVDGCVSAFLTDALGDGACPARSAKTIGKGAKGELACQAKDVTTPGTFTTCDMKEDGRTTAGLNCANVASVLTDIDDCDTAIVALVTATTTTSTTTTTLPSTPCTPGGACGTCGSGTCITVCPSGTACISNVAGGCTGNQDCAPGDVCVSSFDFGLLDCGRRCVALCSPSGAFLDEPSPHVRGRSSSGIWWGGYRSPRR